MGRYLVLLFAPVLIGILIAVTVAIINDFINAVSPTDSASAGSKHAVITRSPASRP
jgi:hypothetical protein